MASWAEMPPGDVEPRLRVVPRVGRRRVDAARGPRSSRSREPMSVYEVHLGSWRKRHGRRAHLGPADRRARPVRRRPRLQPRRADAGDAAPVRRVVGLPRDVVLRPGLALRRPGRLPAAGRRASTRPASACSSTGCPGHFATDEWALARFDGTPLYEDPNPQRGWHKEWGSHIFNFGRREVRNFLYANALYWLEEFHADGLRVDGVASMLYLDYARTEGEWTPEQVRRQREPRGRPVPPGDERHRLQARPRRDHDRRGVDVLAGRHPHHRQRRSRLRLQVEHGLDARLARLPQARARPPVVAPQRDDVRPHLRLQRELRAPALATTRSSTARALCCGRCPATAGSSWRTCAPTSPSCGPTPASSCSSWAARSARSRSGPSRASSTGGCSTIPSTSGSTG